MTFLIQDGVRKILAGLTTIAEVLSVAGFSLFEIMVVITLLSIMLFFAFFYQGTMDQFMARTELDTLYLVFITLSQKAYYSNKDFTLTFNTHEHSYRYENVHHKLAPGVLFGYLSNLQGPPSHPIHPLTHPITFINNQVTFYRDGAIQAGTVYITDKNNSVSYALSSPIAQISYLRRYFYANNAWALLT
jgi:prepilin-type N-terminal cleavage/methylation domain-containing protein